MIRTLAASGLVASALFVLPVVSGAQTGQSRGATGAGGTMAGEGDAARAAAEEAMGSHLMDNAHMRMTPLRRGTHADSVRAAELVAEMREDLAKYKDVRVALADGFREFLPNIPQPTYHFTNYQWAIAEAFRFDPAKPTSLLYRKNADGSFTLTGVMYATRQAAPEEELDSRIPLSIARWHQHVNWCMPKRGEQARWSEMRDGKPVFGPASPIATYQACQAVGGEFHPNLFGWMVHANVFESDDPAVIWGGEMHDHGHGH